MKEQLSSGNQLDPSSIGKKMHTLLFPSLTTAHAPASPVIVIIVVEPQVVPVHAESPAVLVTQQVGQPRTRHRQPSHHSQTDTRGNRDKPNYHPSATKLKLTIIIGPQADSPRQPGRVCAL
jgi:hypothetical protein